MRVQRLLRRSYHLESGRKLDCDFQQAYNKVLSSGSAREAHASLLTMYHSAYHLNHTLIHRVMTSYIKEGNAAGAVQVLDELLANNKQNLSLFSYAPNEETFTLLLNGLAKIQDEALTHHILSIMKSYVHPDQLVSYSKATKRVYPYVRSRGKASLPIPPQSVTDWDKVRPLIKFSSIWPDVGLEADEIPNDVSLAALRKHSDDGLITFPEVEQVELESRAVENEVKRFERVRQELVSMGKGANVSPSWILLNWFEPLVEKIKEEQKFFAQDVVGTDRSKYGPFLAQLPAEKLAVIAIHNVLGQVLQEEEGAAFAPASIKVGEAVQNEVNLERMSGEDWKPKKSDNGKTVAKRAQWALANGEWGSEIQAKVGAVLIHLLLESASIHPEWVDALKDNVPPDQLSLEDGVPAFQHVTSKKGKRQVGKLVAHERVYDLVEYEDIRASTLRAHHLPMLVKPRPWTGVNEGGYLTLSTGIMRMQGSYRQMSALKHADLSDIYDSLNTLSEVPWRINPFIYEVMSEAWKYGGGIADLPRRLNHPLPEMPFHTDAEGETQWIKQSRRVDRRNSNLHSLRCDVHYKLQVAKEFLRREQFYYCYNLDFRGRVYPIPPHLNHMGQDMCRGMLMFGEGKPVGKRGLHWLKVHLANVYGNDKITFEDRAQWTESMMDHIQASVADPLGGSQWWLSGDSPWQVLAACKELVEALRSPDPDAYVCHLPIHQDGSCNGLQHYAALGRDFEGGKAVNLVASDRPQDVYSGVARLVAERVERDAAEGHPMGKRLQGRIERKTIKQTVMTSVYGVSLVGARQQIENAIADKPWAMDLEDKELFDTAMYITKLTFDALQEMFLGARATMTWLSDCAQKIARTGNSVTWTTPLGLPVVQPYRNKGRSSHCVKTLVQTVVLADHLDDLPVSVQKQRTAFPPNYVHSLDSTHMMKTALSCRDAGIPFASVHDSFWVHASNIDEMSIRLRESFVDLHDKPLLQQLLDDFKVDHPGVDFDPVPQRGDLNLREVLSSPYFFQ